MSTEKKPFSRKKFLAWSVGLGALLTLPAWLKFSKKKKKETVKMLTQDGRLVEICVADIPAKKQKIEPKDIPNWVHKKPASL